MNMCCCGTCEDCLRLRADSDSGRALRKAEHAFVVAHDIIDGVRYPVTAYEMARRKSHGHEGPCTEGCTIR